MAWCGAAPGRDAAVDGRADPVDGCDDPVYGLFGPFWGCIEPVMDALTTFYAWNVSFYGCIDPNQACTDSICGCTVSIGGRRRWSSWIESSRTRRLSSANRVSRHAPSAARSRPADCSITAALGSEAGTNASVSDARVVVTAERLIADLSETSDRLAGGGGKAAGAEGRGKGEEESELRERLQTAEKRVKALTNALVDGRVSQLQPYLRPRVDSDALRGADTRRDQLRREVADLNTTLREAEARAAVASPPALPVSPQPGPSARAANLNPGHSARRRRPVDQPSRTLASADDGL
eukprot:3670435-Rhodomonas_salina.1